ncbi:class I SAM-dependent methyltransferase [Actinoplanes sp. NPDC023714]|uniref:class I SAM-dependent methyltransferase n=1 Tax=Actinoplanes sp. NPDC023714 TaxID=3154322 RepID=UPI0033F9772D
MTFAGSYDELYAERGHAPLWGPGPGRLVGRILEWCSGGEVLDAGCGDGKNALFLERHGFAVTGMDVSSQALDLLADRFAAAGHVPKGSYLQGDVAQWAPDGPFDVLLSYGLFHCLDPADRVRRHRELQASVRPGGIIVFCALSDGIPMPDDHRTPGVTLAGPDELSALWDGHEIMESTVGQIAEEHPPHVPLHRHEVTWTVARVSP